MAQNIISTTLHPSELEVKKLKDRKVDCEILPAICALLNHPDGGNLLLDSKDGTEFDQESIPSFVRSLEQKVESFGLRAISRFSLYSKTSLQLVFNISSQTVFRPFSILSNLYLPSDCQVLHVSPVADHEVIHDILNEIYKPVCSLPLPNPENWIFIKGESLSSLEECKVTQFKWLKSEKGTRTSLVDRILKNKFASYVSAFANDRGGHIFYGIRDDGVVEGQIFDLDTNLTQEELTKKVAKVITHQMKWPKNCGLPEKGKHWDIHVKEVIDGDGQFVPSTFVIIISVAACPGGVFATEPESYELVKGEVQRTAFEDWKDKYACRNNGSNKASQQLRDCRERNNWESFKKIADAKLKTADNLRLVVYSQQAAVAAGKGDFEEAYRHQSEYKKLLSLINNNDEAFQANNFYRECVQRRAQGNFESSLDYAQQGLKYAQTLKRGADEISVLFLVQCVSLHTILARTGNDFVNNMHKARKCAEEALELTHKLEDFPLAKVDLEQRVFINQALIVSKSCLTGEMPRGHGEEAEEPLSENDLTEAWAKLESANVAMQIGVEPPLISSIEHLLAMSDVLFRSSQLHKRGRAEFDEAVVQAKKARRVAEENSLKEYKKYAQRRLDAFEGSKSV